MKKTITVKKRQDDVEMSLKDTEFCILKKAYENSRIEIGLALERSSSQKSEGIEYFKIIKRMFIL